MLFKVQIYCNRPPYPRDWVDESGPVTETEANEIIEYHKWVDSCPPVATHYLYRKVPVSQPGDGLTSGSDPAT